MEQSRIVAITNTFKSHLGRIPTSPELKTYLSAKGEVTDLVRKTSEYRYRVKSRLDQVYRSLVGSACEDDVCDRFVHWCDERDSAPAHECSRDMMQEFVSQTTPFMDKYTKIVDEVYQIQIGKLPDINTKKLLATKFKDDKFTVQDLASIINDTEHTGVDIIEGRGDAVVFHKEVPKLAPEMGFVEIWQRATAHRIDIYEFLRYYNELGSSPAPEKIRATKEKQDHFFSQSAKVYRDYLNVKLDFQRFSALHMHEYDSTGFLDKLVKTIVKSHEYRERMCSAISDAYEKTFDSKIHEDDLEHTFRIVQRKSLPIKPDEISGHVFDLGEELNAVAQSVASVYNRVLLRDPDEIEVRNCVSNYRNCDVAEQKLEDSLYDEMEYREVLKSIVQMETGITKNSEVFRIMRKVLQACDGNLREARDHIGSCVAEG